MAWYEAFRRDYYKRRKLGGLLGMTTKLIMSDEKALLEEEKEEMGLTKNDPSSMEEEEEEMAEEKPAVERSDRDSTYTVEGAVEKLGFGSFQLLVTVFSGLLWVADAMELMLLSVLSPAVKCQWELSPVEEAIITSVVFVGFLFGGIFWGILSDKIGRKMGLLLVDIVILVFGILSAIPLSRDDVKLPGYPWLLLCRFGVGFGAGGTGQAVTYYAEFLPKRARGVCITLLEMWWAFGSMFGAGLALAVMPTLGWHWYLGLAATPLVLVLVFFPFMPESARFYVVKGEMDKAEKVIRRIAWYNCRHPPKGRIVSAEEKERLEAEHKQDIKTSPSENGQFSDAEITIIDNTHSKSKYEEKPLLKSTSSEEDQPSKSKLKSILMKVWRSNEVLFVNKMWQTTVLLLFIWFGCAWLYYGIVLLTTSLLLNDPHCGIIENDTNTTCEQSSLNSDDYIKILWTTAAELPGLLVTLLIIEFLGRKKTMAIEFIACMAGFLLLYICAALNVITFFLFFIRAFATGVFQTVYVYTPEVYPTSVRGTAMGYCSAAARLGAIITPFFAQVLLKSSDYATFALYAMSCLVLMVLALLLPIETKGRSMKDEGKSP